MLVKLTQKCFFFLGLFLLIALFMSFSCEEDTPPLLMEIYSRKSSYAIFLFRKDVKLV